jgi:mannose-6-phosphate isomerase-like protein (cupin superfamily)
MTRHRRLNPQPTGRRTPCPRLHRHSYDETWVVIEGNLTFQAGEERLSAGPGDVVIVPPETPHKFTNDGPGPSKLVCVHASPTMETTWLE